MTTGVSSAQALDQGALVSFLRESPRPVSHRRIAEQLGIDEAGQAALKDLLESLVAEGTIVRTGQRYGCPERMNLVVGRLSVHPDGFGFIVTDDERKDVYVAAGNMAGAMHGDRVVARIEHRRRSGRVEGRIIRVLQRARRRIVGRFEKQGEVAWVTPLDARLGGDVQIPPGAQEGAGDGEIVTVEIVRHAEGRRAAEGRVCEVLGRAGDPSIDVEIVIREFDLPHEFPAAVLEEAGRVPTTVRPRDIEGRTDFRELPIVTIDGENAQDFDDAVYVEVLPNGNYRLQVHIADVSYYVAGGSAIDEEARRRATSVYFPGRVVPMLPESLSNGICSLRPEVDRLVHSVLIEIDRDGRTANYEFHDGVIHSAARMTYRQVAAILEGDEQVAARYAEHRRHFERMRDLAQVLAEYRRERGSIDFDLPEPEILINLRGETEDVVRAERNIAHRIIEEFMIRANEVVAGHLTWEAVPALYRVHEGPDPEKIERFREFISGLGYSLGGGRHPRPRHFMELLERIAGRPEERVVTTLMLRTMKQARYQVDNEGHFGLASERYTHFTSPIRRYPDLVIHRLLKADRNSERVAAFDREALAGELAEIAANCSRRERVAEEAEREYCNWKKVQFMADKLGDVFEGHITGVRAFGFFVELEPFFVEGLVPVSSLGDDYYRYEEAKHALRGESTGRVFRLGDRVRVQVAKVDVERRRIDFAVAEGPIELPAPPPPPRRSRRGRRGRRPDVTAEVAAPADAAAVQADAGEATTAAETPAAAVLYAREGAKVFRTTDFGDEDDRVVVREDGRPTYFAADIAYHRHKFQRGFDRCIDVWGADHHGYIPRVKASLQASGLDPEALEILLIQFVGLLRNGVQVKMSTRSGEFEELRAVLDEVGADAVRFGFLMRRADSQQEFDIEAAKRRSLDNPVFYVQYGHARLCSILRKAADLGVEIPADPGPEVLAALALPEERDLCLAIADLPHVVRRAAEAREPHQVCFYLMETIKTFHGYYTKYKGREKVLGDDPVKTAARLALVDALRVTIRNGLTLLKVSAPERMDSPIEAEPSAAQAR